MDFQAMMTERYAGGQMPWDDELPPPEVQEFVAEHSPGRALDLGCGYGRSAIFLAQHGWQADGVDFVAQAVAEATRRAETAGVAARTHFYPGDVTQLDFLTGPYDLALDIGCAHCLLPAQLAVYQAQLHRLLRPGGHFLLFARLDETAPSATADPLGLAKETALAVFTPAFSLLRLREGMTHMASGHSWASGWFLFTRQAD